MEESGKLFSITIPMLVEKYGIGENLNDDFIITTEVAEYIEALHFPLRLDATLFGITQQGCMQSTINLKRFVLEKNSCIIGLPDTVVGIEAISSDYKGVFIAVSMDYLRHMGIDLKTIFPYYGIVRNHPSITIPDEKINIVYRLCDLIIRVLAEKTEGDRTEEVVKGLFSALIFRMCENFDRADLTAAALKTKSKEYYYVRFMELLQQEFRLHREIGYYSDRLFVTPKYLSSLIKGVSGMSAAQWIDEYTIAEAYILLKFSDKNIQQVAEALNFPSQSFFSKYFKLHTGLTPSEWRENNRK